MKRAKSIFFGAASGMAAAGGFIRRGLPKVRSDFVRGVERARKYKSARRRSYISLACSQLKLSQTFEIILPNLIHKSKKRNLK